MQHPCTEDVRMKAAFWKDKRNRWKPDPRMRTDMFTSKRLRHKTFWHRKRHQFIGKTNHV
jgi:hypothetical protein